LTTIPLKAIAAITQMGARVVLLDIDMPGKDGFTLLHEIKRFDARSIVGKPCCPF